MVPIFPSIRFLLIIIAITILLVIASQKLKKFERLILSFVWVVYMCIILAMTLPSYGSGNEGLTIVEKLREAPPWNLKPFSLLSGQFFNMLKGQSGATRQFLGNIILFIPAGFFPPMLFPKLRKWYGLILPGLLWSLFIEISQLILNLSQLGNRSFDTDDIILNVFGAMIGYVLYKVFLSKKHKTRK